MVKVVLDGTVLAESDKTVVVEGNHYFPPDDVRESLLQKSDTHTVCPWKGTASYYSANFENHGEQDIAWYYPQTIDDRAKNIKGYVAFYKNKVEITA